MICFIDGMIVLFKLHLYGCYTHNRYDVTNTNNINYINTSRVVQILNETHSRALLRRQERRYLCINMAPLTSCRTAQRHDQNEANSWLQRGFPIGNTCYNSEVLFQRRERERENVNCVIASFRNLPGKKLRLWLSNY